MSSANMIGVLAVFFWTDLALSVGATGHRERRTILTFPPDSLLQITMGIASAGDLERNHAAIVLALQQNAKLPNDTLPLALPPQVVTARGFSIYDHLKDVITSYGFHGAECLRKMICQAAETPLLGGLLEDVVTFVLSPSKHRSIMSEPGGQESSDIRLLLESEALGRKGGNCNDSFPLCARTPLDVISTLVRL